MRAREHGFFGGLTSEFDPGPGPLGMEHWARHGIVGRGVLVDVARYREQAGRPLDPMASEAIGTDDLQGTLDAQGSDLRPGDIVCIRTGWIAAYRTLDRAGREAVAARPPVSGLSGSDDMARWLWNAHPAALVLDNPTVEVAPGDAAVGSLHRRLLPGLGFALAELVVGRQRRRRRKPVPGAADPLGPEGHLLDAARLGQRQRRTELDVAGNGPELGTVPDDHPFRREFRRWLEDNVPGVPEPFDQDEKFAFRRAWQQTLHRGGWAGPAWPERFGGRGAGPLEQFMYYEELALARAPQPVNAPGIILLGPTLMVHGSEELQRRFLPGILSADDMWCQGFSEPNSAGPPGPSTPTTASSSAAPRKGRSATAACR